MVHTLKRLMMTASIGLTAAMSAGSNAQAQLAVFDATAYPQVLKQVAQGLQQLQTLQQQLQREEAMLARLPVDVTPPLAAIDQQAVAWLKSAEGIGYTSGDVAQSFQTAYPAASQLLTLQQTSAGLADWQARTRATLQEAMAAQGLVAQTQITTAGAVKDAVSASQAAPGQTAALQATNQLLATVSTQLAQLQVLMMTTARASQSAAAEQAAGTAVALSESSRALQYTPPTSRIQNSGHL